MFSGRSVEVVGGVMIHSSSTTHLRASRIDFFYYQPLRTMIWIFVLLVQQVWSQQIGKTPEVHPLFPTHQCSLKDGCTQQQTAVVLDATWRNLIDVQTGASCLTDSLQLNKTICPTAATCGKRCALEGANYIDTGVQVIDNSVTLHMYRKYHGTLIAVGPQIYLLNAATADYQLLHLLNRELSFRVDASNLPCGMNGAMYLAAMDASGGRSQLNPAGAAYGTGYCDSQCYTSYAFVNGVANVDEKGACCNEMDLWEANARSNQVTAHPCNLTGFYACEGRACGGGRQGVCDNQGCGFNPYGLGAHGFYGLRGKVDTTRPFRVVTRFVTSDQTDDGELVEIQRLYIQDGRRIPNADVTLKKATFDSISDSFCQATDAQSFEQHGGLKNMGEALRRGMVLVMGIWNERPDFLNWLDSGDAGPCNKKEGNPAVIKANDPTTSVTFSDIRWGDIGSTY